MPFCTCTRTLCLSVRPRIAHELDEAARAIAAMLDLAAVAIEDAVSEIDAFDGGLFDQQQLISADAEMPVRERAHLRGAQVERLRVAVEHDEVVARAVHFGEFQFHAAIVSDRRSGAPNPF